MNDRTGIITHGQARRIAAEWHSPLSAFSTLSHTGRIEERILLEIDAELRVLRLNIDRVRPEVRDEFDQMILDLEALRQYCTSYAGQVQVLGWSDQWDNTRVMA